MGGGARKRRQQSAETRSGRAADLETQRARDFQTDLGKRRESLYTNLSDDRARARTSAANLSSGGFDKKNIGIDLEGRGREGYQSLADTGGFTEGQRTSFLRRATAPIAAFYNRTRDEISRKRALQGPYGTGFDSADARAVRQGAQEGAQASLRGNVALDEQVRSGRLAGLTGLERTRAAAGREGLDIETTRAADQQTRDIASQNALNRIYEFGVAGLNEIDRLELQNRLQSGQLSQQDAQLLSIIASQDRSLYDNIVATANVATGALGAYMGGGE
jgi:hypothetical protein